MNNTESIKATASTPSRRTIVKGAAWAVPAIAVAGATPAFAVSPDCLQFTLGDDACKWPGSGNDWSYNIDLCVTNNCTDTGAPLVITVDHLETNSGAMLVPCGPTPFPATFTVAQGATECDYLGSFSSTNSASKIFIFGWVGPVSGNPTKIGETPANPFTGDCAGDNPCIA